VADGHRGAEETLRVGVERAPGVVVPELDAGTVERGKRSAPHDLWIYSQFTCPWKDTLLTLIVSPNDSKVDAYVEQLLDGASSTADDGVDDDSSKKRKRATDGKDDKAMPYLPKDEAQ